MTAKKNTTGHTAENETPFTQAGRPFEAFQAFKNFSTPFNPFTGMESMMTKGKTNLDQLGQDAAAAGKEGLEAFVKSGNIFAKGVEDMLKTAASLAQDAAERNAQAFKALLSSKTLNEFTALHSAAAQQNFDDFLTGVTKLSELGVKLTTQTLEPINDQIAKTMKKASDAVAA